MSKDLEKSKDQQNNTKNNNSITKEDEEKDTKDDSHNPSLNNQSKEISDEKIIELIPGPQILNDVQKRLFILSPTGVAKITPTNRTECKERDALFREFCTCAPEAES